MRNLGDTLIALGLVFAPLSLLSFGGGPHYCLGAALARTTLEESVRAVAELAPQLSAEPDSLEWSQVLGRSPARLPVTI